MANLYSMSPKTLNYQEAKTNFSEICEEDYGNDPEPIYVVLKKTDGNKHEKEQTYVLVKALRYLVVHFLKKALLMMIYNSYRMFKSLGHLAQVFLPGVKRDSAYSSYYVQTHSDDVLSKCERIIVIVENEDENLLA